MSHDLKLNGCISDNNIKILENLPKETLVEVIERFGHGFIFKEYNIPLSSTSVML